MRAPGVYHEGDVLPWFVRLAYLDVPEHGAGENKRLTGLVPGRQHLIDVAVGQLGARVGCVCPGALKLRLQFGGVGPRRHPCHSRHSMITPWLGWMVVIADSEGRLTIMQDQHLVIRDSDGASALRRAPPDEVAEPDVRSRSHIS